MLLVMTFSILVLIFIGAFNTSVRENLVEMSTLILGLFALSFPVWEAKQYLERKNGQDKGIPDS